MNLEDVRTSTLKKWHKQLTEICDSIKDSYGTYYSNLWTLTNEARVKIDHELKRRNRR